MKDTTRTATVLGGVLAVFLAVQLGALALVEPFQQAGLQSTENPQNPLNSVLYVGFLLFATAGILLVIKYDMKQLLRGFILLTSGLISAYVFGVVLPTVTVSGVNVVAFGAAALVVAALFAYPEWWVIDTTGVVMGMGAAALFGISFGVLPALVLLTALAVYDAISVYGTEHMLTLASGVMELRLPIVLVFPTSLDYSFLDEADAIPDTASDDENDGRDDGSAETDGDQGALEREAFFVGLGDAVMPTILVASVAAFPPRTQGVFGIELPALTAMVGTLVGVLVLMRLVFKGRAHAGLPLLNGGAILGYLVGALAAGIPLVDALGLTPYV
ncbi:presenilin family intramembrane aspartyl protease PSH [Halobacterium zhouii]|uniref:presenilin family intramembrane aspartyl protease PSH n=1 Tax=Halobacterium zhouii TaxID=2902624 RepID=UPI001E36D17F|nr:presenilin family intramembrane aspartyl protease PSH [Halobacterium zhouii]